MAGVAAVFLAMLATSPAKITEPGSGVAGDAATQLAMAGPTLSGRLQDGRAYSVVAERAVMAPGGGREIMLESVRAAMETDGGRRIDMEAPEARFDRAAKRMRLAGGVIARRSDGYVLRTDAIEIWQAPGGLAARSVAPTRLHGPEGFADAAGVVAAPGLDPIRLTGPVAIRVAGE